MTVFRIEFLLNSDGLEISTEIKVGVGRFLVSVPKQILGRVNQFIQSRNMQSLQEILGSLKTGIWLMDSFIQRIDLFHFEVVIGTGDPLFSALSCGGAWAMLGSVLAWLNLDNRLRTTPQLAVHPDYNGSSFKVYFHCIFQFTLGQIILNELRRVTFAWYARTFS